MSIFNKKTRNITLVGLLSFFGGISQDIFVPILPLYLANVLGFNKSFIGLTEGIVTSSVSIFRVISGFLVDKFGQTKPFIFIGYFFSMIARFFLAFVTSGPGVLALRFLDGLGKGEKDSPKDALIAASSVTGERGRGFGIARALDTLGSVAGPLILFALLFIFRNSAKKYELVIALSAIPLIATLLIIRYYLEERPVGIKAIDKGAKGGLPAIFYWFLLIVIIFALGNSSDAFLILRAQNLGVTLLGIPLVYALFNLVYASASVPLGTLSDKIGREKVILIGWLAYALAYFGFARATHDYQVWIIFAFYGLYYATTEGVAKAFIADMVAPSFRGRAYGIYNTAIGLVALPASFFAGYLWDHFSPSAPFYFGSGVSAFAIILLIIFYFYSKKIVKTLVN